MIIYSEYSMTKKIKTSTKRVIVSTLQQILNMVPEMVQYSFRVFIWTRTMMSTNAECTLSVECSKMWEVFIIHFFSQVYLYMEDFRDPYISPQLLANYIRLNRSSLIKNPKINNLKQKRNHKIEDLNLVSLVKMEVTQAAFQLFMTSHKMLRIYL